MICTAFQIILTAILAVNFEQCCANKRRLSSHPIKAGKNVYKKGRPTY